MKRLVLPAWITVQQIVAAVVALSLLALIWYGLHTRDKAKKADALTAKVDVMEGSAEISRKADEQAGHIMNRLGRKAGKDREIINAARNPAATTADHDRVQQRAVEAYLEGQRADCRLQRAKCGPAPASAAAD